MNILKKVAIILVSIVAVIILAPICFIFLFCMLINIVYPSPDVPVIKEAEFPFEIVYEKNGEIIKIEDIYVCKYDGVNANTGGKYRRWKEYFKSGNEDALTVFEDETTEVSIEIGNSWYYMADPEHYKPNTEITPFARRITHKDGRISYKTLSEEDLYSEYGVKIISWKLAEPIENTYVTKKWYEFWK